MSIIIKGMEMPKTGVYVLSVGNTGKDKTIFTIAEHTHSGKIIPRHVGEAVPVPPHGRLIDADALKGMMPTIGDEYLYAREMIEEAPTVIEEEAEE